MYRGLFTEGYLAVSVYGSKTYMTEHISFVFKYDRNGQIT